MIILTASGIQIKTGRQAPLTNAFRSTLNHLAGKEIFPVNINDLRVVPKEEQPKVIVVMAEEKVASFQRSACNVPMRMSYDQQDARRDRNHTNRHIGVGCKVPRKIYDREKGEIVTVLLREETIYKGYDHDSHGKHGRKPFYKDFSTRRPKEK